MFEKVRYLSFDEYVEKERRKNRIRYLRLKAKRDVKIFNKYYNVVKRAFKL